MCRLAPAVSLGTPRHRTSPAVCLYALCAHVPCVSVCLCICVPVCQCPLQLYAHYAPYALHALCACLPCMPRGLPHGPRPNHNPVAPQATGPLAQLLAAATKVYSVHHVCSTLVLYTCAPSTPGARPPAEEHPGDADTLPAFPRSDHHGPVLHPEAVPLYCAAHTCVFRVHDAGLWHAAGLWGMTQGCGA